MFKRTPLFLLFHSFMLQRAISRAAVWRTDRIVRRTEYMDRKKRCRQWLWKVLILTVIFTLGYTWYYIKLVIPDQIHLVNAQT